MATPWSSYRDTKTRIEEELWIQFAPPPQSLGPSSSVVKEDPVSDDEDDVESAKIEAEDSKEEKPP